MIGSSRQFTQSRVRRVQKKENEEAKENLVLEFVKFHNFNKKKSVL